MLFNIVRIIRVSIILKNVRFVLKFVSGILNDVCKIDLKYMRAVRKVKNVCAYNPHSCFIVPDQSFGVFSRV